MTDQTAALALATWMAVPQLLKTFLPSPAECRLGSGDPTRLGELRRAEIIGAGVALAASAAVARAAGDPKILVGSVLILAVMVCEYERGIRGAPHTPQIPVS